MIVTMPDGIDVEFPDDMPREKIKGIIEKKYPKEVGEFKGIDVSKLDVNNVMSDDGLNSQPSSKIDVMLSVAKLITPKDSELGRFVRRADWGVRTIENTDFSKLGTEGAKSAGRAINASVVGGTGFLVKMAGDMFYPEYNAKDYEADTVFTRVKKFKDDSNRAVFGAIRDFGQSVQDFSERVNTSEYLKADEKLFAGDWEQNPNLHKVTDLIMSGATSVVGAYVMSSVAGPAAGLMLFSGIDAKDLYEEAREKGVSKGKAFGTWLAGTAGTAYLEKFGVESAFGVKIGRGGMTKIVNSAKSTTSKITDAMLANAGEEYLQTVWQNLSAKVGYDEGRDIFQNAVESAVGGAFGGGLVASFNFGYQAFKSKSQKAGLTQQEQDNVITAVGQAIANNPDMVDVPFQENMKKTYASFQQMIKELGDTPEAERLKETKRQLDEVYSKTFEQLKDKMPEKQAKAVSDIARSSALFFSDLEGMSVGEWFEKNAPQIKKVDSIENEIRQFAKNIEPIKTRLDLEDINLFEALKNPDIVKRYREKDTRSSLLQFIKKRGGAVDAGGELKAMDIGKNVIGAINNKSGESLDDLALAAWENGYFPEKTERPTVNELLEAIRDESFGKKRYAEEKQADLEDMVADLSEALDRMNIDYQNMTAQEIEQAYNDYLVDMEERSAMNAEYADEASRAEDMFDLSYFQVADENQRLDEMYPAYEGETININGQEKTVYNSNGDRIAKSKEALENFYRWFGDSKVVDEQGRPLVVYHGSNADFSVFDIRKIGTYGESIGHGFYFGSKNVGERYNKGKLYDVYLKMENPVDYLNSKKIKKSQIEEIADWFNDNYIEYEESHRLFVDNLNNVTLKDKRIDSYQISNILDFAEYSDIEKDKEEVYQDIYKKLKEVTGIDGFYQTTDVGTVWVAFQPTQIKSTSNRGTYSESENIYYQFAGEKALTAALNELNRAKQLEANGVDNEEIRQQTGWFKGADGKWRFEISDKDARVYSSFARDGNAVPLSVVLEHEKLYAAYPDISGIIVEFVNEPQSPYGAFYSPAYEGSDFRASHDEYIGVNLAHKMDLKKVLMHEIQHVIQEREDFARGGNVEDAVDSLRSRIAKVESSQEMWDLQELFEEYDMLNDVSNVLRLEKDPESVTKTAWFNERFLGVPKNKKARKEFLDEKGQEFLDYLMAKYKQSGSKLDQYFEYLEMEKPEIDKMRKSVSAKINRLHKKVYTKDYASAKHLLSQYKSNLISAETLYKRLAGEIEARNTETRMDYTDEQRRAESPESTQDVANADAIVVFDDGTAMAYEPERYNQENDDRDLVALHTISASNLEKAIDFGGFPVPSIAIINKKQDFHFNNMPITLVGNKEMIDPSRSRNEVYNRDIWSKTFPFATYGKVKKKTRDNFRDNVKEYFVKTDSENELGSLLYYIDRGVTPERAVTEFQDSDGARLMYLEKEKGEKITIPTYDAAERKIENINHRYGIEANKQFIEKMAKFDSYPSKEVMEKDILPLINEAIDNSKYEGKEKYAESFRETARSIFIEDGRIDDYNIEGLVRECKEYVREKGTKKIDTYALRDMLKEKITDVDEYNKWAEKYIQDNLVGEPLVAVGKKLLPFNLENVTKAMTQGVTKNAQESFVYGSGKVIAAGAKQLKSIKEIKLEGKKLVSKEEQEEKIKELQDDMNEFTNKFMTSSDFTSSMQQKEAAFRALGTVTAKENPTNEDMQKALNYEFGNSKKYSDELLAAGVRVAKSSRNIARYYFEAKPQRAVRLNEFSGAIIPTDTKYDNIAKKVEDAGLKVIRSDNQTEALQEIDTEDNVFFQSAFAGSRVDYDRPSLEAIGSGEGHQAHGWGLYYALDRDVAEGYRERSYSQHKWAGVQSLDQEFGELKVNGKPFLDVYNVDISRDLMETLLYKPYGVIEEELENRIKGWQNRLEDKDYQFKDYAKEKIEAYSKLKNDLYENGVSLIKQDQGQVHEVDIPENPYLLDEQKTFREQSAYIKKQLRQAFKDVGQNLTEVMKTGYVKGNPTGGQLYGELMSFLDGDAKKASLHLEKHGIKGITYDGNLDGRCFVIFNPADVKVIQKFYQGEQSPLGAYVNRIIYLSKNANASTLPHELAHFWSDMLRSSKSLRAKEILREVDKWANKEFDRKFSTVKTENGYAVVDKSGKTIYDRMGDGFATEEQARAYAKEELFARGFEKYLSEGKAPSKTLRQAFANFYNWLKKIYVDMMSLDIKLSKPMRDVYATILGGTSIDTFLDSDIDEFIEKRAEAERERDMEVRGIIQQAQGVKPVTLPEKIRKAYEEFDFGETWKKIMIPLSTRAKRVAPTLRNKIRRYEFDVLETKQAYYREIEPMLKKWKEFSKEDSIAFDLALKNGAIDIRDEILRKYNAVDDFAKVTEALEDIYYKANDAGLEVGYIEDYFPRKVKDKDGLLSYLHGTDEWSGFQEALHREDPHGQFSAEEQAEFIDKYLRGIVRADLAAYKYSSEKARKLDTIDNVLNQYYADSMQALIAYIDGMNARISTVNFFGRNRENVDESIGEFVAYLLNNNEIKPSQVDEVKSILNAVFKRRGVGSKWIKAGRDMSYIYTMGGVNTAITQLDDIFVAAYKGGVINTFSAAFQKDRVTKKDLGLDSIAAEFVEGSGVSKAVNWVFKHNGIELIDGFGKNALLNGVLKKMEQMSDADLRKYLEPVMEEETEQTMKDIRNGELSANVRFFLFNELSDMQPVSLSELPELYNVGGNARIFYMLKSFMLKRIDTLRNEVYDKMRSSDQATRIEGWKNMYRLILLMMLGGATKDLIIDLMYNRVIDLNDTVVNNLFGMVGISKYNIYQVREEGMGHTLAIFATPPLFSVAEDLSGDVNKYIAGKREFKDFEVFKGLPIIGRFYYWLYGGGKTKTEKKKKKQR